MAAPLKWCCHAAAAAKAATATTALAAAAIGHAAATAPHERLVDDCGGISVPVSLVNAAAQDCVSDGAGLHQNNERCTVRANYGLYATAISFQVERYWDYLTIGGTRYSGQQGPINVPMAAAETFSWYTDRSVVFAGWTVCATTSPMIFPPPLPHPPLPTPPPPPAPSPPPPAQPFDATTTCPCSARNVSAKSAAECSEWWTMHVPVCVVDRLRASDRCLALRAYDVVKTLHLK